MATPTSHDTKLCLLASVCLRYSRLNKFFKQVLNQARTFFHIPFTCFSLYRKSQLFLKEDFNLYQHTQCTVVIIANKCVKTLKHIYFAQTYVIFQHFQVSFISLCKTVHELQLKEQAQSGAKIRHNFVVDFCAYDHRVSTL